jgi:hypothetical protein
MMAQTLDALKDSGERTRLACTFRRPRRNTFSMIVPTACSIQEKFAMARRHRQHARARVLA